MSSPLVILTLIFSTVTPRILVRLAVWAWAGVVDPSDPLHLCSLALDSSKAACRKGHEAVWLLLFVGSLVMDFHFIGLLLAAFLAGSEGPPFARVLAFMGAIMAITLTFVVRATADSATKDSIR